MKESKIVFGKMVDYFRKQKGFSMEELGGRIGKSKSAISRWVSGERYPKIEEVEQLASFFETSVENLLFGADISDSVRQSLLTTFDQLNSNRKLNVLNYSELQLEEQNNVIEVDFADNKTKSIVRGRKSAAGLTIAGDDSGAYEEVLSASMVPKGADELVEITGSSMEPLIKKGSEVFLRYQPNVESGEIAIVRIENEGVTCKRVYFDDGTITLKSENPEYEDMHFDPSQVTVLGKVLL